MKLRIPTAGLASLLVAAVTTLPACPPIEEMAGRLRLGSARIVFQLAGAPVIQQALQQEGATLDDLRLSFSVNDKKFIFHLRNGKELASCFKIGQFDAFIQRLQIYQGMYPQYSEAISQVLEKIHTYRELFEYIPGQPYSAEEEFARCPIVAVEAIPPPPPPEEIPEQPPAPQPPPNHSITSPPLPVTSSCPCDQLNPPSIPFNTVAPYDCRVETACTSPQYSIVPFPGKPHCRLCKLNQFNPPAVPTGLRPPSDPPPPPPPAPAPPKPAAVCHATSCPFNNVCKIQNNQVICVPAPPVARPPLPTPAGGQMGNVGGGGWKPTGTGCTGNAQCASGWCNAGNLRCQ